MRPVTPVGILASLPESLGEQFAKIDNLDRAFSAQLQQAEELANNLDPYLNLCTAPESLGLATLVKRTQSEDWSKRSRFTPNYGAVGSQWLDLRG